MKKALKIISLVLVLVIAYALNTSLLLEHYNSSSLYGSFTPKLERAHSIQGEKFIIIGGSSSNLGIDSQYFESLTGRPTVNLAVSAGVPLRVYMKAAEDCAASGDTIIMALEYSYYSNDFYTVDEAYIDVTSVDASLKCKEAFLGNVDYYWCNFLRSFTRLNDLLLFSLKKTMNTTNTIYIADSVNSYGDFVLHRNRMPTYNRTVTNSDFHYDKQVVDEINDYIQRMKELDVSVYITYPAFDMQSIKDYETYSSMVRKMVETYFPARNIIGTPKHFSYDEDFFFDTPYHLQYKNRKIHTKNLFDCYQSTVLTTAE